MKLSEFTIGVQFGYGEQIWRCTDVGSRVVAAICISDPRITRVRKDGVKEQVPPPAGIHVAIEGWLEGPPYAVTERLFNERDIGVCVLASEWKRPTEWEALLASGRRR